MIRIGFLLILSCLAAAVHASDYWSLAIPVMDGATNVELDKDRTTASYHLNYDISLSDHKKPIEFYGQFFESNGWVHHMREVYSKFTHQFDSPPMDEWSSTAANSVDEKFVIQFGTLWQNEIIGSDASLMMSVDSLNDADLFVAHIEVTVHPRFNPQGFMEVTQSLTANPKSMLKLAKLVGGDPFQIENFDLNEIDVDKVDDPIIQSYLDSVKAVLVQIEEFAKTHIPAN